ncbi:hypothetical protein FACS1894187_18170 [Synergistales bacterium]|nr:hypothetical protein FACS1894187_18170 [Synergistales bacterium]
MNLIIFTGAPASGKSSFAKRLSESLSIVSVSKDEMKIQLFQQFGFSSHAEKKKLSMQGERLMYDTIREHCDSCLDLIVDNNFKNFNAIRKIVGEHDVVLCVSCYANSAVLARRYNERIANRQRSLSLYTLNKYPTVDGLSEFHKPIDSEGVERIQREVLEGFYGKAVLAIDTTRIDNEYETLYAQIESFVLEYMER